MHQEGPFKGLCHHQESLIPTVQSGTGSLQWTLFIPSFSHTSLCCHVCSRMETSSKPINHRNVGEEVHGGGGGGENSTEHHHPTKSVFGLSWDAQQKQTPVNRVKACANRGSTCIWGSLEFISLNDFTEGAIRPFPIYPSKVLFKEKRRSTSSISQTLTCWLHNMHSMKGSRGLYCSVYSQLSPCQLSLQI